MFLVRVMTVVAVAHLPYPPHQPDPTHAAAIRRPISSAEPEQPRDKAAACRSVATELTAQMTAGPFTASLKTSCSFEPGTKQSRCIVRYSDNRGTTSETTTITTYNAVADIVDEVAVNPPLTYAVSAKGAQAGGRGTSSGGVTNTFDDKRRIIKTVNVSASGESTTTYSDWDAAGRPTRATDVGKGFSNVRVISYDNVARTRTTVVNGGPLRTVETFDLDGNQIETATISGGASITSKTAITVLARSRVCK